MHVIDMTKVLLTGVTMMALTAAQADNSPYMAHVYDFVPAPGQFVNVSPAYTEGDTQDSINAKVEAELCGGTSGMVSLGSYGGYIVFGFDHPVINMHDYDIKIYGNSFQSSASTIKGGSCEPGIIMVGVDADGDGVPSAGDLWYEIKGSEWDRSQHGYEITYYKPDENKTRTPSQTLSFLTDTTYVRWTSNDVVPDSTSGYVPRNSFHQQSYWPQWITDTVLTFRGTKLPNTAIDLSGGKGSSWHQPFLGEGYADNLPNDDEPGFKIDWAIDEQGNSVSLDHIDFVKVYCGQLFYCGWMGETSTEVCGAEDLHPDATAVMLGDVNGDGKLDITDVTALIDYILGGNPTPFVLAAADVDGNGSIAIGDVTSLIDMLLSK